MSTWMLGSVAQLFLVPWDQGHDFMMLLYLVSVGVGMCSVTGALVCCHGYAHLKSNHSTKLQLLLPVWKIVTALSCV